MIYNLNFKRDRERKRERKRKEENDSNLQESRALWRLKFQDSVFY